MAMAMAAVALEIVPPSYFTLGHPGIGDLPRLLRALSFDEILASKSKANANRDRKVGADVKQKGDDMGDGTVFGWSGR